MLLNHLNINRLYEARCIYIDIDKVRLYIQNSESNVRRESDPISGTLG